ncbi:MAG TPA: BON domain-containing protein [Thermoanaerobaculia bacterium]
MRTVTAAVVLSAILLSASPLAAATPQTSDLTNQFVGAAAGIDRLQVYELAGIVILRGRTTDKARAEQLGLYARERYARVANLIQIVEPQDDQAIERAAERELTVARSLDGCRFSVESNNGVVNLAGSVRHELQKDVARQILRSLDGVREVRVNLERF